MMYEELVKDLRYLAKVYSICENENTKEYNLAVKAADAIEELNKCLDGVSDAHNEGYDVGYWAGRRDYEPKWIPVTERLPEKHEFVLVYSKFVKMRTDFIINDGNWYTTPGVTHWMRLPEPPKGESNGV